MASNSFGTLFRITTWGESHGKAVGVVIDGCPAGIPLDEIMINDDLALRAPGNSPYTSPRKEEDKVEILSGVFEGKTTGAPISILIANKDADPSKYTPNKDMLKPGHANFTYLEKYGAFDFRGGGRASARETACRVAAGAIAKQLLATCGINIHTYIAQIGSIRAKPGSRKETLRSPIFCPDATATAAMTELLEATKAQGDSIGGIVEFYVTGMPAGLGDPVYNKLEATLAYAMLSIPASKGFEIGSGFASAQMRGSEHNDRFFRKDETITTQTNFAGGTLGRHFFRDAIKRTRRL